VKCTGKHLTKDCDKSKETPPKCVNCGNGHPANYRGCIVAKELQEIRYKKINSQKHNHNFNDVENNKLKNKNVPTNPTTINSTRGKSYAEVIKSPNKPNSAKEDLGETLKLILHKITGLEENFKDVSNRLTKLENNNQKHKKNQ
jgi:hypothetical protein